MSEKLHRQSREWIESVSTSALAQLEAYEKFQGFIPDSAREQFDKDIRNFGTRAEMYKLTALAIGKKVPDREYLYRPCYSGEKFGLSHIREQGRHVVRFYGSIGKDQGEISSDAFAETLWDVPDDESLTIRFNSPGGCYKNSLEIAEAVSKRTGETRAVIDGTCASGASIVAMRCNPIGIGENGYLMLHFVRVTLKASRTAEDLELAAKKMRAMEGELVNHYTPRWSGTVQELIKAMDDEQEFVGYDAVLAGLADYVDPNATVATRDQIDRSVQEFKPAAWRERESKNFLKYRIQFQKWKHAAECMAKD